MRLIDLSSGQLKSFDENNVPKYAILSHRWEAEEATFERFIEDPDQNSPGFAKIHSFCDLLRGMTADEVWSDEDRVGWCWIDTVCIDKRSSAELSEAINSMARWYENAHFCVAHLSDISFEQAFEIISSEPGKVWRSLGRGVGRSDWFTRGWTLQELLFPRRVVFYNKYWKRIHDLDKSSTSGIETISAITGIPANCLSDSENIFDVSIADRMTWAAGRATTRTEDIAYCLLGLFRIYMPLLYGEGKEAFFRLQRQLIDQQEDETVFAWRQFAPDMHRSFLGLMPMLAAHPRWFSYPMLQNTTIVQNEKRPPYRITNRGLEIEASAQQISGLITMPRYSSQETGPPNFLRDYHKSLLLNRNEYEACLGQELLIITLNCSSTWAGSSRPQKWRICLRRLARLDTGAVYARVPSLPSGEDFEDWLRLLLESKRNEIEIVHRPPEKYYIATTFEQIRKNVSTTILSHRASNGAMP